jgi:hypothetical protein
MGAQCSRPASGNALDLGPYQTMDMSNFGSAFCVEFRVCKELCFCIVGGGICLGDFLDAPALKGDGGKKLPPLLLVQRYLRSPQGKKYSPCLRTWDSMILQIDG